MRGGYDKSQIRPCHCEWPCVTFKIFPDTITWKNLDWAADAKFFVESVARKMHGKLLYRFANISDSVYFFHQQRENDLLRCFNITILRTLYVFSTNYELARNCLTVWFLPARRYASAGNRHSNVSVCPSLCLSVCPSVRLSRAGIVSKRRNLAARFLHHLVAPR